MKVKGNSFKNLESDKYRKQIGKKGTFWQCKWLLFTNTTGIIPLRGFDVYNNDKIYMIDIFYSAI